MKSFLLWWTVGFIASILLIVRVGGAGDGTGWLATLGGIGTWYFWVQLRPMLKCPGRCKGTGRLTEWFSNGKYWKDDCPTCGGAGKVFRAFVSPWHPLRVAARERRG